MTQAIVILILALLVCTAIAVVRLKNLWATVMLTGIYSFLGAGWMLMLDAPDVAFTEAAVGAGISTVLFLGTLALTSQTERPRTKSSFPALIIVVFTGAALIYGTMDLPPYGDPNHRSPINQHPNPNYVEHSQKHVGVPNVITAVLGSYRGYDTLGETVVVFTAGLSVILLLGGRKSKKQEKESAT